MCRAPAPGPAGAGPLQRGGAPAPPSRALARSEAVARPQGVEAAYGAGIVQRVVRHGAIGQRVERGDLVEHVLDRAEDLSVGISGDNFGINNELLIHLHLEKFCLEIKLNGTAIYRELLSKVPNH